AFTSVYLNGARFRDVDLRGVTMRGVYVADAEIYGEIDRLTINGVEVMPLVEAELNRRYPERVKLRPVDPAGFQVAWDVVERFWAELVEEARGRPAESLHESVAGEWSFIETLRHLVFATECWARRAILGEP